MTDQPQQRDSIPVPDPSERTREQLIRELGLLRDELTREIDHVRTETMARMDTQDAAAELRLEGLRGVRPETERQLGHLHELLDEKFASVYRMFDDRDIRVQQVSEANKNALDAALAAAKELVTAQASASSEAADKAELATTKQIDQIGLRLEALRDEQNQRREADQKALNQRIDEVKERIDRGEGITVGGATRTVDQRATIAALVGISTFVLAIIVVVVNFLAAQ